MYTLMMMTALSTSPDAAQFNGFFRDLFTRDSGSCQGNTTRDANAAGSNCQGSCHGHGLFHGGIISYFRGNSCQGSCHGNSCQGSSCQGNSSANAARSSCQGSCSGSNCSGSTFASCMGSSCFGSTAMGAMPSMPMGGGYAQPYPISYASPVEMGGGCFGGGMPMGGYPGIPIPNVPMLPSGAPMIMPDEAPQRAVPPGDVTYQLSEGSRATVAVKLPADAKLYAEGRALNLTGTERRFTTPPLPADRDALYTFRIEYSRDGEQVSQSKKVTVRGGTVAVVEFNDLLSKTTNKAVELFAGSEPKLGTPVVPVSHPVSVSAPLPTILPPLGAGNAKPLPTDRAKITVVVPAGSVLYVNGKRNDRTDGVREFTTPVVAANKLFTYVMRVERNGEKEERKIDFMAGEAHTVDFTARPQSQQHAAR